MKLTKTADLIAHPDYPTPGDQPTRFLFNVLAWAALAGCLIWGLYTFTLAEQERSLARDAAASASAQVWVTK